MNSQEFFDLKTRVSELEDKVAWLERRMGGLDTTEHDKRQRIREELKDRKPLF